jgi:iron complex outermembrane receptor protein
MFGNSFAKSQAPDPGYVVKDGVLTNANYKGVPGTDYAVYDMIYRESKAKSAMSPSMPTGRSATA